MLKEGLVGCHFHVAKSQKCHQRNETTLSVGNQQWRESSHLEIFHEYVGFNWGERGTHDSTILLFINIFLKNGNKKNVSKTQLIYTYHRNSKVFCPSSSTSESISNNSDGIFDVNHGEKTLDIKTDYHICFVPCLIIIFKSGDKVERILYVGISVDQSRQKNFTEMF